MKDQAGHRSPAASTRTILLPALCLALSGMPARGQSADSVVVPVGSDARLKVDLLLVVAHPDDESALAGYPARSVLDEGRTAAVVYLFDRLGGQSVSGTEHGEALGAIRQIEARAALAELRT